VSTQDHLDRDSRAIAIVGMAGRFPGAPDLEAYWQNLVAGREGIARFADEALAAAGVDPSELRDPAYVRAHGRLDGIELFDASFFGFTPLEAEITDPQHRLFLETAWQALEDAGHQPHGFDGRIGVFAGAGFSTYLIHHLLARPDVLARVGSVQLSIANNKDYVPTRVSYKLDLTGPSINVNTACSSSLVAVHLACQSLLDYHADMVLAGGAAIQVPQDVGYRYLAGGISSPDGHCRPFDAEARGTVSGNGVGVVVLRRLADAMADGDTIRAVILGSAVNNDGAAKVGYTAPSVSGQAEVIAEALAVADVEPDTVHYVEAHGTGTVVGDPIEVAALTQAFRRRTARDGFCAIGSVKSNIGHLDEAAGIAGLIKTVLSMQHGQIPPSLHYHAPNPEIDFAASPFFVNASVRSWPPAGPKRAGVSSFGIGGTNAHVVLEEAPVRPAVPTSSSPQVLTVSAKTDAALEQRCRDLAAHLARHPAQPLADIAWTLQQGRRAFDRRRAIVATDRRQAAALLEAAVGSGFSRTLTGPGAAPHVVFLFPGQGAQYVGMGRGLYEHELLYRQTLDHCAECLRPEIGLDIRDVLWGVNGAALAETSIAQGAIFAVEYALARLWASWGIEPHVMLGHSLGEYVAATLAGVFSLEDALHLAATRGQLMQAQPRGAMLAVPASEDDIRTWLDEDLSVAAVNAPARCVVAGSVAAIERLQHRLAQSGLAGRLLETSHAFHSGAMDPVLEEFGNAVARVERHAPSRPWMSNVTGRRITPAEAVDPAYWSAHVRQPVRFLDAARTLLADPAAVFLEVGPGRTLVSLIAQQPECSPHRVLVPSLRHPGQSRDDGRCVAEALGRLWVSGVEVNWRGVHRDAPHARVPLPTYPFERRRYWVDPPGKAPAPEAPGNGAFDLKIEVTALEAERARLSQDPALTEAPTYAAFVRDLDAWCAHQLFQYIAAGAPDRAPGTRHVRSALRERLGVQPAFRKCFDCFLHVLAVDGYLRPEGDGVVWEQRPAIPAPATATLIAGYPEFRGIVTLLEHCIAHYPDALSGKVPAITVLYPGGGSDLLEAAARESARHTDKDVYIELLKIAIDRRLATAGNRPVRILEVGMGDGLLAGRIVPGLQGRNVDYVATDISRAFIAKGERAAAAAGLEGVTFAVLDITRDPAAQGFAGRQFDFVICLDVVHATARLTETLDNLRMLLAPDGLFGVIEKVRRERWIDMVWGLAEGWWAFEDAELRTHSPLLDAAAWEALLRARPFSQVAVVPQDAALRATTDYALLLAQGSARPVARVAEEPASAATDITHWFYAPVWRPTPLVTTSVRPAGRTAILDDESGVGARLAERLTASGHDVAHFSLRAESTADDYRALLASLSDVPAHVVYLGSSFFGLLHLAQALSGTAGEVTLSIVSTAACHVEEGDEVDPIKALLAGPLRVIPLELPRIACRQIDMALDDDGVVDQLTAELVQPARDRVVAYRRGVRLVQTIEPRPLAPGPGQSTGVRERGVYLITGGFGSMGMAFARDLARAARARLVLVGRTDPSPAAQAALLDIEALGGEVLFLRADVADAAEMQTVVAAARTRFGALHGVIHTAGVYGQGLIWDRDRRAIEATFRPKVSGVRALEAALAGEPLDFLVLCSSLAAVLPAPGQVDYCAANAVLDLFAAGFARRTGIRTVSIGWGMWQALGMMDHPSIDEAHKRSVRDEVDREGWQAAGVEVLRRVLAHETPAHLLVSPRPTQISAAPSYPLFAERRAETPERIEYVMRLHPGRHWMLDEHRLDGRAILPGTAYLELARAACADAAGAAGVELRDVFFLSPLIFEADETKEVRLVLTGDTFHVVSRAGSETASPTMAAADSWIEHARGGVRPLEPSIERVREATILEPETLASDAVPFGPRWHNLRSVAFGDADGIAELVLPDAFAGDLAAFALHPALLDMAVGFITLRHPLPDGLPFAYRRIAAFRPLPARFRSHVRVVSRSTTSLEVDATLVDERGVVLARVEGYRLRSVPAAGPAASLDNARLAIGRQGSLDSLTLVRSARRAPAAGEVEIQVEAAGLNFVEVLYALGMLPAAPALEDSLGLECAGRVVRAGAGSAFGVGDRVIAYANGCFAGYVTVADGDVARMPAGLSAREAATLPAAFATAHYALVTQGRLAAGERVLIHAAAGGVGMAAVQIAQRIGAEIHATAGTPAKRAALAAAGVAHVMDSRSPAFADEVMARTGGRGVDVVLNSLGGELMARSLELVAPHGRFLELGKRDLLGGGSLPLAPFTRIISFIVIDVGPDLPGFADLWRAVTDRMHTGEYRPLPHTAFPMRDAQQAFEFMARARHIGKVVLTIEDPQALWREGRVSRPARTGVPLAAIVGDVPSPRPAVANDSPPPLDDVEGAIAAIWKDLLGVMHVGPGDNFFDLHGDSLLAAQVMGRLQAALQVTLPLSAIFDEPTVVGLAARVRAARSDDRRTGAIPRLPDAGTYALSQAQRRLWVLTQMDPESAAYNVPLHFALRGPLRRDALEQAFAELVARHESLRTRFTAGDGEPRQVVDAHLDLRIEFADISGGTDPAASARVRGREHATQPFDLARDPLIRITILRLADLHHVVLLTLHHIVADGTSLGILVRELSALYQAALNGRPHSLPPLPVQYRDYAAWQNASIESDEMAVHRRYWLEALAGELPVLELPLDAPRPATQTFIGRERGWHLPPERAARVAALARSQNASLFMLLSMAVKALLQRHTGQEDIVIGTPAAGRAHPDLEGQVGFYLNMLPLRDRVSSSMRFVDLLQQVRTTATAAYDHQAYPFDRLVRDLNLARDLSRSPVFDVIVILQNQQESELELEGLRTAAVFDHNGTSKVDLTFNFKESARGLAIGIEFNTDLFSDERIRRMGAHLLRLLDEAVRDPLQAIGSVDLLSAEERAELAACNDTARVYPVDRTLLDLVRRSTAAASERVACSDGAASLTYRQLQDRAAAVAGVLARRGVARGDRVGVYLDRSADLLPALLGIMAAGAAYVPLDPAFPPDRLRLMEGDAGAAIVVTRELLAEAAASTGQPAGPGPRPGDLAYVIYTSGSTGRPKGVAIEHRSLVNFLCSMQREPGLGPDDTLLAVTTLSFDIAGLELFLPLLAGARVVIATRDQAMDGRLLQAALRESGATVMQATPATWQMLIESGWPGDRRLTVLCGGEALPRELAEWLTGRCARVWNLYGPTETTIWSSVLDVSAALGVQPESGRMDALVPIGRPIANTSMHVLDARLQQAPAGVAGELYVGGDGLARGYVGLPGLTAERFVPDPFSPHPGARMYRTGDRAVRRFDGTLEFLGRFDHQIKLRGHRIEIGEVENALLAHPRVARAAVVLDRAPAGPRLLAAIVRHLGMPATDDEIIGELRQHLRTGLPEYMVPAAFIFLDDLPRTLNGKVDRNALRGQARLATTARVQTAPSTAMERRVAAVWTEVLGIDEVGVETDFFQAGGHSLTAARLAFRIGEETGVALTLMEIFQHPTVAALAQLAAARTAAGQAGQTSHDSRIPIAPITSDELDMLNE
jgi:amino acid adenylation domain-containing protein